MKRTKLLLVLLLVATGANAQLPNGVTVWHDDDRGVTCWVLWAFNRGGISCLPDSSLPKQAATTSEAGRASQTSTEPENLPQQATPRPQNERLQL